MVEVLQIDLQIWVSALRVLWFHLCLCSTNTSDLMQHPSRTSMDQDLQQGLVVLLKDWDVGRQLLQNFSKEYFILKHKVIAESDEVINETRKHPKGATILEYH